MAQTGKTRTGTQQGIQVDQGLKNFEATTGDKKEYTDEFDAMADETRDKALAVAIPRNKILQAGPFQEAARSWWNSDLATARTLRHVVSLRGTLPTIQSCPTTLLTEHPRLEALMVQAGFSLAVGAMSWRVLLL